ncbi:VOC family protein [Deinococcus ruber]|nr:VOC family protein [Deinococcus ruber]
MILNYLSFVVADMARSLEFYRTLGLPVPAQAHLNAAGEPEDHVEVSVNGLRIAWETETLIAQVRAGWTAPTREGRLSVAFDAGSPAGVDAACARVRAEGFTVSADPYDAFWGQRYATLLDPDGNSVDVFAWLAK